MQNRCPRCLFELDAVQRGGIELDVCRNCHGFFVEDHEHQGTFGKEGNPNQWVQQGIAHKKNGTLPCPKHSGAMDVYELTLDEHNIELDVCSDCNGLWLDGKESLRLENLLERLTHKKDNAHKGVLGYLAMLLMGIPIEEWNPVKRRPWMLYFAVALNIAVFALQIGISLTISDDAAQTFAEQFSVVPARIWQGEQLSTFLTYAFLHAGILHILGNLYFLWIFGDNVEDRCGHLGFAMIYVVTSIAGGVLHLLLQDPKSTIPMLGASGAVSGFMGAYWVLFPKVKVWVVFFFVRFRVPIYLFFGLWVVTQVGGMITGVSNVAWYAHGGGFIAGLLFGVLYRFILKPKALKLSTATTPSSRLPSVNGF